MGLGHLIPTAQSATTRRAASSTTGALNEKEKRLAEKSALDAIFNFFHIPLHLDIRLLRLLKTKKSIAKLFACNRERPVSTRLPTLGSLMKNCSNFLRMGYPCKM